MIGTKRILSVLLALGLACAAFGKDEDANRRKVPAEWAGMLKTTMVLLVVEEPLKTQRVWLLLSWEG